MIDRVIGFCANTRRPSKTRALVESVSTVLHQRHGIRVEIFDLADTPIGDFELGRLSPAARELIDTIEQSAGIIVGTPVYNGSYSGFFKHVFDLVRQDALFERPVLLTANGGGARHCLMVEHQLRPLLGFFEACTVPTTVYASESDFEGGALVNPLVLKRIGAAAGQFAGLIERQRTIAAV